MKSKYPPPPYLYPHLMGKVSSLDETFGSFELNVYHVENLPQGCHIVEIFPRSYYIPLPISAKVDCLRYPSVHLNLRLDHLNNFPTFLSKDKEVIEGSVMLRYPWPQMGLGSPHLRIP